VEDVQERYGERTTSVALSLIKTRLKAVGAMFDGGESSGSGSFSQDTNVHKRSAVKNRYRYLEMG
jgi:hypothetical protein